MTDPNQPWRVAIVDDNPDDRAEVRRLLLSGSERRYRFTEAETGASALAALRADHPPECLLLDFNLPDMDAVEVLRELAGPEGMAPCPVVVFTGAVGARMGRLVLAAGAQDYVGKDQVNAVVLTRAVENAIERFRLTRQVKASEARFRALAERMPHVVLELDAAGAPLYANARWSQLTGLTQEATGQGGWLSALHPEDAPRVVALEQRLLGGGGEYDAEARIRAASDGAYRWFRLKGAPVRDSAGRLLSRVITGTDIDDQKRAEERLRESHERLRLALEASQAGTYLHDLTSDQAQWSSHLERLLGYEPGGGERGGGDVLQHAHPEDRGRVALAIEGAVAGGGEYQVELRVVPRGGGTRWVSWRGRAYARRGGKVDTVTGVLFDIHAGKEGQEELRGGEAGYRAFLDTSRPGAAVPTALPERDLGELLVLVVDDNRDSAESMAMVLELHRYRVLVAYDGHQALEVALRERPQVVLLDIGLPVLNGYQACKAMRAGGLNEALVVAMSGYCQEDDRRRAYEAGFDGYHVKPLDLPALQQLLARRAPRP